MGISPALVRFFFPLTLYFFPSDAYTYFPCEASLSKAKHANLPRLITRFLEEAEIVGASLSLSQEELGRMLSLSPKLSKRSITHKEPSTMG